MLKRTLAAAVAAAALLHSPAAFAGKSNDTLNIAWDRSLENVDMYFNTAREGIIVGRLVWDALMDVDPNTGEYKPALATSWKWIDPVTLEMELRQGVKFHNGEKFDADDVVYTLNFISDPANGVKTQSSVNWIKNCEKLGEYKVRINLKEPFPAAFEFLSGAISIYPNEYYAKVGPDGMGLKPVGTGPYKVTEVEPGQKIVFEKNENYYKDSPKGQPTIGKIVQRTIPEVNTQIAELISGRLDWMWRVPADQAEKMGKMPMLSVVSGASMRIGYLTMDAVDKTGQKSPLNNVKVRQAVSYAIDRQAIIDALVKGGAKIVNSACFPSQFGCTDDVVKYKYDPAKAKQLLAEAGYPNGFKTPFFAYRDRPVAEAMMGFLNAVGIQTDFSYLKYAALRDKIRANEVPFAFMTWGSNSINDVSAITSVFFKHLGDDLAMDDEVKKWLDEGDTSVDPEARKAAYAKALKKIAEQAYWLPLFNYTVNYAFSKNLDFTPNADEIPRFYAAKWK